MIEKKITVKLTGLPLEAIIILSRDGQESPDSGDKVRVMGSLLLPCETESWKLDSRIQFQGRVILLREPLRLDWGGWEGGHRFRKEYFFSEKWALAFAEAEGYFFEALKPLQEALSKRAKALLDAEE